MMRPMSAQELGGEAGNVVDVLAGVPLVATSDRLDCLRKYHDGARGLGELLETGQACLASCGRACAMEAHDYRRDRRARWGLGQEIGAIRVACSDYLLLESHGTSIAVCQYRRLTLAGASAAKAMCRPAQVRTCSQTSPTCLSDDSATSSGGGFGKLPATRRLLRRGPRVSNGDHEAFMLASSLVEVAVKIARHCRAPLGVGTDDHRHRLFHRT